LTKLLEPPAYLTSVELSRDSATLAGQAEQAAPLLKLLDDSSMFTGSKFTMQLARNGKFEVFRIRCDRKGIK
jgi:hypothetical protein